MAKIIVEGILYGKINENDYNVSNLNNNDIDYNTYSKHINSYSFENWYKNLIDAKLVHINDYNKDILKSIANNRVITGRSLDKDIIDDFSKEFIDDIQSYLTKYNNSVFIKTSEKSSKNDTTMKPLQNIVEIIDQLTSSKDILVQSLSYPNRCKNLIIQPWNNDIQPENEYRVIVENKKILAISQQKWYTYVGLNTEMVTQDANKIYNWYMENKHRIPYEAVVLDVYVTNEAHLIECNPGYSWGSSGSALFHWENDKDKLYANNIYVRYVMN